MQIYTVHWENSLFYLLHFTLGLKLKKCFSEIKGFKVLFECWVVFYFLDVLW